MEFLPIENEILVCRFCKLYIVNRTETKMLTQHTMLNGMSSYSSCPMCGQAAINPEDQVWCKKIDTYVTSLRHATVT